MFSVQIQSSSESSITDGTTTGKLSVFRHLKEILAAILARPAKTKAECPLGYEGYAWCDSSERQVSFDIASCRRTWLF